LTVAVHKPLQSKINTVCTINRLTYIKDKPLLYNIGINSTTNHRAMTLSTQGCRFLMPSAVTQGATTNN
jgi:hypothetical protein